MLQKSLLFGAAALLPLAGLRPAAAQEQSFRPPAVPLVASNPYLSIWSEADKLTDDVTRHWTHRPHPLSSLVRIDGKTYRLMGTTPATVPALPQTGVQVLPTRSIYQFAGAGVHLSLSFTTPILPQNLDVLTRPVTYITWNVQSIDGKGHQAALFLSAASDLTVNETSQKVVWGRDHMGSVTALHVGTDEQPILQKAGDDMRIDWGYAYLAAPSRGLDSGAGDSAELESQFVSAGKVANKLDTRMPRPVKDANPAIAISFPASPVMPGSSGILSRHAMIAYDEIYSIDYFGKRLRPYWRRNGGTPSTLLQTADKEYPELMKQCEQFDTELMADMTKAGGARYAQIAALAYRQCLAATGIAADSKKQMLLFTKENTSNGDIATVDVIFPMDPMLILLSPTLAKASLVPILQYAASPRWKFPNSPHDLGTYPHAHGTDDGGEGMPVEESGNMILLCDAIAQSEGNARFIAPWWDKIKQWEDYLEKYGNDPEDQLCTDDFMGHLAHNSNLSIKAILAIAAYGDLCEIRGEREAGARAKRMAREFAAHWVKTAEDGGHSRLAFDQPKTWSQKYNLVWDKILGLNTFPASVAESEIAYYKSVMQPYGVPLDSRTRLTKSDWSVWSATLANNRADFEAITSPLYDYLNKTTARQPLCDSYITDNINSDGMHARSVVGGIFIKMLAEKALWKKWVARDKSTVGPWAALPVPPKVTELIPTGKTNPQEWSYTTARPADNWAATGFDDSSWQKSASGFGTDGTPGIAVHTRWATDDIWLRRKVTIPAEAKGNLQFFVFHDEDVEIYVNGVRAAAEAGFGTTYMPLPITPAALALLKPGATVTIAVHCHQTTGGQGIDVGLATVEEVKQPE
jgi:Domain of unknown function (DUF4965)/Domain of unknown function (DUF5127)/Domain of unknown function (DUF1793)/Domain of unknown function (DUF4964)